MKIDPLQVSYLTLSREADQLSEAGIRQLGESLRTLLPWSCAGVVTTPVRGNIPTRLDKLLAGEADHRDLVLAESERASNIMVCVSRSQSPAMSSLQPVASAGSLAPAVSPMAANESARLLWMFARFGSSARAYLRASEKRRTASTCSPRSARTP